MAVHNYDVVVIGTGPAGESAAINAAKHGMRVAIIEKQAQVGGNCTHWGTIPSKALRHQVKQIMAFNTNRMFRDIGEPRWFSFPKVMERSRGTIDKQVEMRHRLAPLSPSRYQLPPSAYLLLRYHPEPVPHAAYAGNFRRGRYRL